MSAVGLQAAIDLVVRDRQHSYPALTPDEAIKDAYDNVDIRTLDNTELGRAYELVIDAYRLVERQMALQRLESLQAAQRGSQAATEARNA